MVVCALIPAQCNVKIQIENVFQNIIFANVSKEGWDSGVIRKCPPSPDLICNFANKGKLMRLLVSVKSECFAAVRDTRDTVTLRPVCRVTP